MNPSYFVGWCAFRALFATYFRCRVYDADRVPLTGPVIFAANHASFIDPPLIGAAVRRQIHFLARDTLFTKPILGAVLRSWKVVPVDREGAGAAGLKAILERLLAGGAILLFPEGTRTRDGRMQAPRSGIGLTVIKSDCPVVPVRVFGTYEAFGRHVRFPRPYGLVVKFGDPMRFTSLRTEASTCSKPRLKAIYREVAAELMTAIGRLQPSRDVSTFP